MEKLAVQVRCHASSVLLSWSGCELTATIPASGHTQNIQIERIVGSWKFNLLHNDTGFGKPYLLNLTNQEKNDEIKMSIIPERNFVKTNLLGCRFKSLREFSLTGPNIQAMNSQHDNTPTGMILKLNSNGAVRLKSRPMRVKSLEINGKHPEDQTGVHGAFDSVSRFDVEYVGETGCALGTRKKEHNASERNVKMEKSALVDPAQKKRNLGNSKVYLDAGADIICQEDVRITGYEYIANSDGKLEVHGSLIITS